MSIKSILFKSAVLAGPRSPSRDEIMPTLKQFRSVRWVKDL